MRRAITIVLVAGLLGGALVGPVDAKKKKKKKPPVTFSAEGSISIANSADYLAGTSATRNEFQFTCAIPASQGLDGFVIELPDKVTKITSDVRVTGSDATGQHDLDMYFYDESCSPAGEASSEASDEVGVITPGTKYVVVTAFFGAGIDFAFESVQRR